MRKLLQLFLLLLFTLPAYGQCSGSGTTWSCPPGATTAQVNAALAGATDGATITFAAGTYALGFLKFSNSKGATMICASPPQSVGASTTAPCLINGTGPTFGSDLYSGTNTHFYRISGFTMDMGGGNPGFGLIYWSSYNGTKAATLQGSGIGGVRVDHNTFQNGAGGAEITLLGDGGAQIAVYGVYDHNLLTSPNGQMSLINSIGPLPNPLPSKQLGTINNLFFEDNTWTSPILGPPSAEGCVDSWTGAYVIRHNTSTNCLWAAHGETHGGGPVNYEFYNNQVHITDATASGFTDCTRCIHHQGSGTMMIFNNTFYPLSGKSATPVVIQEYRASTGNNGVFTLSQVANAAGTVTYTGTGLSGLGFLWFNITGFTNAANNTYWEAISSTSTTATGPQSATPQVNETHAGQLSRSSIDGSAPFCDGTVNGAGNTITVWADGNRSPITTYRGYPCFNQPGRDLLGNIVPHYYWDNLWNDGTKATSAIYDSGGPVDWFTNHVQAQREYFDAVSNLPNSSPTAPFNGTTGTGFGTLANRPTTCTSNTVENAFNAGTSGVGYFATDVGAQGTLYQCSATNTWTVFYAPYTYPHPLVGGSPTAFPPSCSPGGGTYSGVQSVTCTNPSSAPVLCQTQDGTLPITNGASACTHGTVVSGAISVTPTGGGGTHLLVVAGGTGFVDSSPFNGVYTLSGGSPIVSINPSPATFTPNLTVTLTITNTGTGSQVMATPFYTITGPNSADFVKVGGTCANGATIPASGTCSIAIQYTQTLPGQETASLNILGTANGSVSLIGSPVVDTSHGAIWLTGNFEGFGTVRMGQ